MNKRLGTISLMLLVALGGCKGSSGGQASANGAASGTAVPAAVAAAGGSIQGAGYCAQLQPRIQALVKPTLTLFQASDASSDPNHAGERPYVDCDFRPPGGQFDIGLHDDSDGRFDNAAEQGYAALSGFGDKARYVTKPQAGMRWVDVVKGKTACEARISLTDGDLSGPDWKQVLANGCGQALQTAGF